MQDDEHRAGLDPRPSEPPSRPSTRIREGFAPVTARDFDSHYGLEVLDDGTQDGRLCGRVAIRDELRQPFGLLHGGVISAMAEALASRGTWIAVHAGGKVVMGLSNETHFMRPLSDGYCSQIAVARHRGATRWLWEVESRDDQDRLCALTTVNVAVRDARPPRAG